MRKSTITPAIGTVVIFGFVLTNAVFARTFKEGQLSYPPADGIDSRKEDRFETHL